LERPRQVFEEHGFDVEELGIVRVNRAVARWRASYRESGVLGALNL
jgi:transposase